MSHVTSEFEASKPKSTIEPHGNVIFENDHVWIAHRLVPLILEFTLRLRNNGDVAAKPMNIFILEAAHQSKFALALVNHLRQCTVVTIDSRPCFRIILTAGDVSALHRLRVSSKALEPLANDGWIDYACIGPDQQLNYGKNSCQPIHLLHSQHALHSGESPVIVIANKTFQTLPHELFHYDLQTTTHMRCIPLEMKSQDRQDRRPLRSVKQQKHLQGFLKVYSKLFQSPTNFVLSSKAILSLASAIAFTSSHQPLLYLSAHDAYDDLKSAQEYYTPELGQSIDLISAPLNHHAMNFYTQLRRGQINGHHSLHTGRKKDRRTGITDISAYIYHCDGIMTDSMFYPKVSHFHGQDLEALYQGFLNTNEETSTEEGRGEKEDYHHYCQSLSRLMGENLLSDDSPKMVEGKQNEAIEIEPPVVGIEIEKHVRFSDSMLWTLSQEYYDESGLSAWGEDGNVPSFITTNCFIASEYAQLLFSCIQSWKSSRPLYIIELGAGTGKLGFYIIQDLLMLYEKRNQSIFESHSSSPPFVYVLTDFTLSNVNSWRNQDQLQNFVRLGILDFAVVDAIQDQRIQLLESGIEIEPPTNTTEGEVLNNNIVLIANYLFDSLPCDVFRVENGQLFEGKVTTTQLEDEMLPRFSFFPIKDQNVLGYYPDHPEWNQLLTMYQRIYATTKQTFYFPTSTFQCIQHFHRLIGSTGQLLIITSDKGAVTSEEIQSITTQQPYIDVHGGSISVALNFHSIIQLIETQYHGHSWTPASVTTKTVPHERLSHIKTCIFGLQLSTSSHQIVHWNVLSSIQDFSPDDFFILCDHHVPHSMDEMLAILRLAVFDPDMFYRFRDELHELMTKFVATVERDSGRPTSWITRCYLMPIHRRIYTLEQDAHEILFEIARLAMLSREYAFALDMLLLSQVILDARACNAPPKIREEEEEEERSKEREDFLQDQEWTRQYTQAHRLFLMAQCYHSLGQFIAMDRALSECTALESLFEPQVLAFRQQIQQSSDDRAEDYQI